MPTDDRRRSDRGLVRKMGRPLDPGEVQLDSRQEYPGARSAARPPSGSMQAMRRYVSHEVDLAG